MALSKPTQMTVPFANSGQKNAIPTNATGTNRASMTEGFPAVTMLDINQGGLPPYGEDVNGILFDVTTAIRYIEAGGLFPYNSSFASAISGYPLGALLTSADGTKLYQNQVAGNTSNPDNNGSNWKTIDIANVSSSSVTATGSTTARTLANRFADVINVKDFGAKGDGVTDDTAAIQAALSKVKLNSGILFFPAGTYLLSKQTNATNYPNGDAPCLFIKQASNIEIVGSQAELYIPQHGQSILEIVGCSNIKVSGLRFRGYGSFPQIDTNSGLAEKGDSSGGYFDGTHYFPWFKNNSINTSSYKGFANDPDYVWGAFGNGNIGSLGAGIVIYDGCSDILVEYCEFYGFNYAGIVVGLGILGSYSNNSKLSVDKCNFHNIYDRAVSFDQSEYVSVTGCYIENIGHPVSIADVLSGWSENYQANPGYGIVCQKGNYKPKSVIISSNQFRACARIGIDSHNANNLTVTNNKIEYTQRGGINISDGGVANINRISDKVIVSNNSLYRCGLLRVSITSNSDYDANSVPTDIQICGNQIRESLASLSCVIVNGINNAIIANNIIDGIWGNNAGAGLWLGTTGATAETISASNIDVSGNVLKYDGETVTRAPIIVRGGSYINIHNNIVDYKNADRPIEITDSSNCLITNNIIAIDTATYANISQLNSTDLEIIDNRIICSGSDTSQSMTRNGYATMTTDGGTFINSVGFTKDVYFSNTIRGIRMSGTDDVNNCVPVDVGSKQMWFAASNSDASSISNLPAQAAFFLEAFRVSTIRTHQTIYVSSAVYMREYNNGVWTAWTQIA